MHSGGSRGNMRGVSYDSLEKDRENVYNIVIVKRAENGARSNRLMNEKMKSMHFDELFRAILSLKTEDEVCAFFEDICTVNEMKAMLQRLQVAELLDKGEQYSKIVAETGASTATISRVNRCLLYGSDGYHIVLERMKQKGEQ